MIITANGKSFFPDQDYSLGEHDQEYDINDLQNNILKSISNTKLNINGSGNGGGGMNSYKRMGLSIDPDAEIGQQAMDALASVASVAASVFEFPDSVNNSNNNVNTTDGSGHGFSGTSSSSCNPASAGKNDNEVSAAVVLSLVSKSPKYFSKDHLNSGFFNENNSNTLNQSTLETVQLNLPSNDVKPIRTSSSGSKVPGLTIVTDTFAEPTPLVPLSSTTTNDMNAEPNYEHIFSTGVTPYGKLTSPFGTEYLQVPVIFYIF